MATATAQAHPNIAFIKYWGNRNNTLRLPMNGSISMNLNALYTRTIVSFQPSLPFDKLIINGHEVMGAGLERVSYILYIVCGGHQREQLSIRYRPRSSEHWKLADCIAMNLEAGTYTVKWFSFNSLKVKSVSNLTVKGVENISFSSSFMHAEPVAEESGRLDVSCIRQVYPDRNIIKLGYGA